LSFYRGNLATISTHWPDIALKLDTCQFDLAQVELVKDQELSLVFEKIQLASSYNQAVEAQLQISALPTNTANVTLYGSGLGIVQKMLLENRALKSLHVVVLNLPLFKASLTYFDHNTWLVDPRVNLSLPQAASKIENPFIALPAELELSTDSSAPIRDRLCLALDNDFIEQSRGVLNTSLQNDIMDNLAFIARDNNVNTLFSSCNNTDFIVCGAGPTLADHFDWLKQPKTQEKYTIVAVDTAVKPMIKAGIIPDIIVSIDSDDKGSFDGIDSHLFINTPLVYFPVVQSDLLSCWQGPRYTAYSMSQLYSSINKVHAKGRLFCCGCVLHPSVDLAVKMGATKVLLLGADFAFPGKKTHTHCNNEPEKISSQQSAEQTKHWVLDGKNERVPTLLCYRGYLRDLEDYIELIKGVTFYNGSDKGALIRGTTLWKKFQ
jgi:hypothetical protein